MRGTYQFSTGQFSRLLIILLLYVVPATVLAQENEPVKDTVVEVKIESIPLTSMSSEAERTSLELKKKKAVMLDYETARRIRNSVGEFKVRFDELKLRSDSAHLAMGTRNGLRDLRLKWMRLEEQLDKWQADLGDQTIELEEALVELNDLQEKWALTKEKAVLDSVPEAIVERIDDELLQVEEVRSAMNDTLSTYVVGMDKIVQTLLDIREHIEQIRIEEERTWSGIFSKDSPAIWEKSSNEQSAGAAVIVRFGASYM